MLSKYESYSKDSKKIVASLLLSMKECVKTDGASMRIFGGTGEGKAIFSSIMDVIDRHHNSFVSKDNYFIPSQYAITSSKKTVAIHQQKKEKIKKRIKMQNHVKINIKMSKVKTNHAHTYFD